MYFYTLSWRFRERACSIDVLRDRQFAGEMHYSATGMHRYYSSEQTGVHTNTTSPEIQHGMAMFIQDSIPKTDSILLIDYRFCSSPESYSTDHHRRTQPPIAHPRFVFQDTTSFRFKKNRTCSDFNWGPEESNFLILHIFF